MKLARKRWSINSCRKRERNRVEIIASPLDYLPQAKMPKMRRIPFDLKITLERRDGMRIHFNAHFYCGRLIGEAMDTTPKQFGRKLGEIFELWMTK